MLTFRTNIILHDLHNELDDVVKCLKAMNIELDALLVLLL